MVSKLKACVLLLALTACTYAAAEADEAVVVVKGEDAFAALIKENDFVAVEFYAPWCGHCKKLAPEWETAAKTFKGEEPKVVLANIDCTAEENKALAEKYGVKGFPTIKVFRGNDAENAGDYEGPREAKGIVTHLKKQAGPPTSLLEDAAAVTTFAKFDTEKDAVVVGVFPDGAKGAEFEEFVAAANKLRNDYEFAHVTDAKLIAEAKGSKAPVVIVLKDDTEAPATTFDGKFKAAELQKWVEKTCSPAITTLDQSPKNRKSLQKIFSSPLPKLLGFATKGESAKEIKDALIKLGAETDTVNVLYSETEGNKGALDYFGLSEKDVPAFVIHDQEGGEAKYAMKNAKADDLPAFYAKFKAGKLEKVVKSEDPPADNSGPVTILTAKTFNDIVFGNSRNVFVEFYAPWCGHCKTLAPIWDKLGEAFKDNDSVVIAKMDATANDVPDPKKFKVAGFPTLKFVKADGEVVDYEGDRSEESLLDFVNSHADTKATYGGKDEL
mmetsp:Transcript_2672/g.7943  ORF Transcript_2672/g.7943 Transcript_2672/m.7943 type:complete len:497 (+) Transcript_2672:181-1671(+)|eukprot:CAMPEP_0206138834 /NCGR_PEP_ID=MMETSP1473-20131121/3720_1 /ASSEMBLY_ACC=CAM_ASM_001109 /TAXON_ID=1461547 /ORGANISM="Stichococcus sp, Strain RCC1054" /LENGTH=496 /DNA_ID=CAMNT_0053532361 /DNA_START=134 /DNA_END=1627 /DNA_ORIENTATION=-